jgi:hypothetical protein
MSKGKIIFFLKTKPKSLTSTVNLEKNIKEGAPGRRNTIVHGYQVLYKEMESSPNDKMKGKV